MPVIPDLHTAFPTQRQPLSPVPVEPPQPPARDVVVEPCTCGHGPETHEHYRPGTDCGACGRATCGEYRRANSAWRRFMRSMGLGR
jgi:hypothetical protein